MLALFSLKLVNYYIKLSIPRLLNFMPMHLSINKLWMPTAFIWLVVRLWFHSSWDYRSYLECCFLTLQSKVVAPDISKAFDIVWFCALILKLIDSVRVVVPLTLCWVFPSIALYGLLSSGYIQGYLRNLFYPFF